MNEELFKEVERARSQVRLGGGAEKAEIQHKAGKKTARERIESIFDELSFIETDAFVSHKSRAVGMDEVEAPGEGVVTGFGTVDGRPVFAFAQDFTVLGGSMGEMHAKKILKVLDMAAKTGAPIVGVFDSAGARLQEGLDALNGYAEITARLAMYSGVIPEIALVLGPCAGGAALAPAMCDFVLMTDKISELYAYGPHVYEAATGEKQPAADAKTHFETGAAALVSADEDECFAQLKTLLGYLPSNNEEGAPLGAEGDPNSDISAINALCGAGSDIREAVKLCLDDGYYFELQGGFAGEMSIGFGRVGGMTVGIVANQPLADEGRITADGASKAARFVRFCDCYDIPVVTFVDCAGFRFAGTKEGTAAIYGAAKLAHAYAEADTPKVTIMTGAAYGAGYAVMGSRALGADFVAAWPDVKAAALPAETAVNIMYRDKVAASDDPVAAREELYKQYEAETAGPLNAAKAGYVDDIIMPDETRQVIFAALQMALTKREDRPGKKHGNLPL